MKGVRLSFGGRLAIRNVLIAALLAALGAAVVAATLPAAAGAHAERATTFPNPNLGAFPEYRTTGPELVVCDPTTTKQRIKAFRRTPARHSISAC